MNPGHVYIVGSILYGATDDTLFNVIVQWGLLGIGAAYFFWCDKHGT